MKFDKDFYKNKKVLVTGHTGFKGSWLCKILITLGAEVYGYSKDVDENNTLYQFSKNNENMTSIFGDIRDLDKLKKVFKEINPEIVIHLAAQPIVRDSYINPVYTYETNVLGTVNICECIRLSHSVKSFLNVTTDKVYLNREWDWGYREIDELNGFDPYSNSKSCSELVTYSYNNSFFKNMKIAVSTARAGNVIGGGDFATDRIIPDCVRSSLKGEIIKIRNPYSTRPYQHVLEPLFAYLTIIEKQYKNYDYSGSYNIGPDDCDCVSTGELVDLFCKSWGNTDWETITDLNAPHEANFLKLDCSKFKSKFKWIPCWNIKTTIDKTVDFYKAMNEGKNLMEQQIFEFLNDLEKR